MLMIFDMFKNADPTKIKFIQSLDSVLKVKIAGGETFLVLVLEAKNDDLKQFA